jgi:hypothetical protein
MVIVSYEIEARSSDTPQLFSAQQDPSNRGDSRHGDHGPH